VPAEVRVSVGEPHQRLGWLVVGPRHDSQPHDPRMVAELEEIARLAGRAMAISSSDHNGDRAGDHSAAPLPEQSG